MCGCFQPHGLRGRGGGILCLIALGVKMLAMFLSPSAYAASEAADEEVMLRHCVLTYVPLPMTSWPTLPDHIVHVSNMRSSFSFRFLCTGLLFPFVADPWFHLKPLCSSVLRCLSVTPPHPPTRSPRKSHQAPHQCKGVLHPANGKLPHHLAPPSRYYDITRRRGRPSCVCIHCTM